MTTQVVATYNTALKSALLETKDRRGRPLTQRAVARRARIDETRFSRILSGQLESTPRERKAIARVLQRDEATLFPEVAAVA